MIDNELLRIIRGRRSVIRFRDDPVSDDEVEAVLEAGRWAPSYTNSQPCEFVVVRDPAACRQISEIAKRVTIAWQGLSTAPVVVVVTVDPERDPRHYLADGAACVQNMVLAASSLGLASFWAGLADSGVAKGAPESHLKTLLGIPKARRLVALVPLGRPAYVPQSTRRPLGEIAHVEQYGRQWGAPG